MHASVRPLLCLPQSARLTDQFEIRHGQNESSSGTIAQAGSNQTALHRQAQTVNLFKYSGKSGEMCINITHVLIMYFTQLSFVQVSRFCPARCMFWGLVDNAHVWR